MSIQDAISVIPELSAVEADLQVVSTMHDYKVGTTDIKQALLEVKTMSHWTPATIKVSCRAVMDVLGAVFENMMNGFNDETGTNIDSVSIEPFKERFDEEIKEQTNLKAAALHVTEMASRVALALNIPVPASAPTAAPAKPKSSFLTSLASIVVAIEEEPKGKGGKAGAVPSAWLIEPILLEGADNVQKLALLDSKLTQSKSPDAVRAFAAKFNMTNADLAEVILDVLSDARNQTIQSESVIAAVTTSFNDVEKVVTKLLEWRNKVTSTDAYVSGK